MRVKIIKSTSEHAWYSGQVGLEFNVKENREGNYRLIGDVTGCFILKSDCEVLPDEQPAQPEPFDLERALKGEKVITRNGREVTEIRHFETTSEGACSIAGVLGGHIFAWRSKGDYVNNRDLDLLMAPKEPQVVTRWVNVYKDSIGELKPSHNFYYTKEGASAAAFKNSTKFIGIFPLTITIRSKP